MKKRLTQAQKQNIYIQDIKERFCKHFGWSEEKYCQLEFEQAFEYIEERGFSKSFSYSKTFWNWWKLSNAMLKEEMILNNKIEFTPFGEFQPTGETWKILRDEALSGTT